MNDARPCLAGRFLSPYVRRVAVTMNHYEMPFERLILSAIGDEEEREKVNPVGRVPALILNETETLIDSIAILDYLDELADPKLRLTPPSGHKRRQMLYHLAIATGAIDRAMTANAERRRQDVDEQRLARLLRQTVQGFAVLETLIGDNDYFGGEKFGQSDITIVVGVSFIEHIFPGILALEKLPKLNDLTNRLEGLPAFMASFID